MPFPAHLPLSVALTDIEELFADNDIKFHFNSTNADTIPHLNLTKVWQDSILSPDLNAENDFNGIKSVYFGNSDERVNATGTPQVNLFKTQKLLMPLDGDVTDISGNQNNGTVTGTETYANGIVKDAFSFTGATHIETADSPFDFDMMTSSSARRSRDTTGLLLAEDYYNQVTLLVSRYGISICHVND